MNLDNGTILAEKNSEIVLAGPNKIVKNRTTYTYIKRFFDVFLSVIGLIVLSPLFLILAILIKADSKGPVFFKHTRIGKNGKKFKMYKFRTMYENAAEMMKDFTEEQKKEFAVNLKMILE